MTPSLISCLIRIISFKFMFATTSFKILKSTNEFSTIVLKMLSPIFFLLSSHNKLTWFLNKHLKYFSQLIVKLFVNFAGLGGIYWQVCEKFFSIFLFQKNHITSTHLLRILKLYLFQYCSHLHYIVHYSESWLFLQVV